MSINVFLTI